MLTDAEMAGCFGAKDWRFASHQLEQERALAIRTKLSKSGSPWVGARAAFHSFLTRMGFSTQRVAEQLELMDSYFGPWLS
ncbi:MAG: hypothetical protein ACRYGM_07250 [Janthinobacterium lividum]